MKDLEGKTLARLDDVVVDDAVLHGVDQVDHRECCFVGRVLFFEKNINIIMIRLKHVSIFCCLLFYNIKTKYNNNVIIKA